MTIVERSTITKDLIRAQDAIQLAFQTAVAAGNLDLAAFLRKQRQQIGDTITKVNGGPLKISKTELLGAFR